MYVFVREAQEGRKEAIVFIQAESAGRAKDMAGIPQSCSRWIVISKELIGGFADVKEGMIVKNV